MYPLWQRTPSTEIVAKVDALGVDHAELGVRDPELCGATAGDLDHLGGEVARDQPAVLADDLGGGEAGVTGPGRELEHGVARPRRELLDEPHAYRRHRILQLLPPTLPAGGHLAPDRVAGAAVLVELHSGDPTTTSSYRADVRRTLRAVRLLAREDRIPRPLRAFAAFGLLPIPGPVDEAALLLVAVLLWVFYRDVLADAWRRAARD
jgi:hypothetical protein